MARSSAPPSAPPTFIFATCQVGAEAALKQEVARDNPAWHFAFSRPGFLTFKLSADAPVSSTFELRSVFARAWGHSLERVSEKTEDALARLAIQRAGEQSFEALHVWQRDPVAMGFRGFEPHRTPAAEAAEMALRELSPRLANLPRVAQLGQRVLDCVLVEADQWWIGFHTATTGEACHAGGLRDVALPADAVSRAYLKMEEGLAWSELPIRAGQRVAEIGCSPGGASQSLLNRGLKVLGVDPAKVDPRVLANPHFTHIQKRGADVRRKQFRGIAWLTADMNVAPSYTLDTVEAIATHPESTIRGLLLTLKLPEWKLAAEVPDFLARIRSWGFAKVRARQLAHNRREICVTALRRKRKS